MVYNSLQSVGEIAGECAENANMLGRGGKHDGGVSDMEWKEKLRVAGAVGSLVSKYHQLSFTSREFHLVFVAV